MDATFTVAEKAPKLPRTPWQFALNEHWITKTSSAFLGYSSRPQI